MTREDYQNNGGKDPQEERKYSNPNTVTRPVGSISAKPGNPGHNSKSNIIPPKRGREINKGRPDLEALARQAITGIDSANLQTDLGNGKILHHDGQSGYVKKDGEIIGYRVKTGRKDGNENWIDAELGSNDVKGPGFAYGIHKKPEQVMR